MNYQLTKTAKGKQGFLYTVTDEAGNVISTRTSKRDYVACTACGYFYFGRLDLIGKGDHGRYLKDFAANGRTADLERFSKIAYLKAQAPATEPAPAPAKKEAPASVPAPAQEEKEEAPATDLVVLERAEAPKKKAFGEHEVGEEVQVRLEDGNIYKGVVHRYSTAKNEIDGLRRMLVIPAEDEDRWHGLVNYLDGTPIYPSEKHFSELVQG